MPHLLWHGASVYDGHLRGPVTLAPNAERLAVELSLPMLTTWNCRGWDSNTQPSVCGANDLTYCATTAARLIVINHSLHRKIFWHFKNDNPIVYFEILKCIYIVIGGSFRSNNLSLMAEIMPIWKSILNVWILSILFGATIVY